MKCSIFSRKLMKKLLISKGLLMDERMHITGTEINKTKREEDVSWPGPMIEDLLAKAEQYGTEEYSTVQYSAVQYSTEQVSKVQPVKQRRVEKNRVQ